MDNDEDALYTYEIGDSHGVIVFHAKDAVGMGEEEDENCQLKFTELSSAADLFTIPRVI